MCSIVRVECARSIAVHQTEVENTASHNDGIDLVCFCSAWKFNIDAVFTLLTDDRLAQAEFIDAAGERLNSLRHGSFLERINVNAVVGAFLGCNDSIKVCFNNDVHTAIQIKTKFY